MASRSDALSESAPAAAVPPTWMLSAAMSSSPPRPTVVVVVVVPVVVDTVGNANSVLPFRSSWLAAMASTPASVGNANANTPLAAACALKYALALDWSISL